jgi:hypothetical protein
MNAPDQFSTSRQKLLIHPDSIMQIGSLSHAYATAKRLEPVFRETVRNCASNLGLLWACRPNSGIKNPDRILEKAVRDVIPLDMLGGKLIVNSLQMAYEVAVLLEQFFEIVAFKDRFVSPQRSGYRDLQFIVAIEKQHYAELKIVHQELDGFDAIEHDIYEIVRKLQNKVTLSVIEQTVLNDLQKTSQKLYAEIWKGILAKEGLKNETNRILSSG